MCCRFTRQKLIRPHVQTFVCKRGRGRVSPRTARPIFGHSAHAFPSIPCPLLDLWNCHMCKSGRPSDCNSSPLLHTQTQQSKGTFTICDDPKDPYRHSKCQNPKVMFKPYALNPRLQTGNKVGGTLGCLLDKKSNLRTRIFFPMSRCTSFMLT